MSAKLKDRKARFAALNRVVAQHGGWLTSARGAVEVLLYCSGNLTASQMAARSSRHIENGVRVRYESFELRELAPGERIITDAIVQKFTKSADGSLGLLKEGSTQATTIVVHYA